MEEQAWKKLLECSITAREPGTSSSGGQNVLPPAEKIEFLQKAMTEAFGGSSKKNDDFLKAFLELGAEEPLKETQDAHAAIQIADAFTEFLEVGNYPQHIASCEGAKAFETFCIKTENRQVRLAFLRLLPLLAENREEFQEFFADTQVFKMLVESTNPKTAKDEEILSATLSAVSAVVRSSLKAFKKFYEHGGIALFADIVANRNISDRILAKTSRIVNNIYQTLYDNKELFDPKNPEKRAESFVKLSELLVRTLDELEKRYKWMSLEENELAFDEFVKMEIDDSIDILKITISSFHEHQMSDQFTVVLNDGDDKTTKKGAAAKTTTTKKREPKPTNVFNSPEATTTTTAPAEGVRARSTRAAAVAATSSITASATKRSTVKKAAAAAASSSASEDVGESSSKSTKAAAKNLSKV